MDYSQFTIGRVVKYKPSEYGVGLDSHDGKKIYPKYLGHITGFDYVEYDDYVEVILIVKWYDGTNDKIHPSRIEVL